MFSSGFNLQTYLMRLFVLFLSISVHEYAHARAAYGYGDDTAALQGRMTLNPLRHFEPIGLLMILIGAPIAWAKPVPVNPSRFRPDVDRSKAMLWVSLAGITSNLLLAFTGSFVYYLLQFIQYRFGVTGAWITIFQVLQTTAAMLLVTNVYLAIFNLLPIPMLDGFELFSRILPKKVVWWLQNNSRVISLVMLLIIVFFNRQFSSFLNTIASPVIWLLQWPWQTLFGLFR